MLGIFEGVAILDQDAVLRPLAHPDSQSGWCGKPERARAGDHHHRHEDRQTKFNALFSDQHPSERGKHAQPNHDRDEYAGNFVCQFGDWSLGSLGVLDQADDLRQSRILTDPGRPEMYCPVDVHRSACDVVANGFLNRQAFTSQHGFIHAA